jgi:hypothetical protein
MDNATPNDGQSDNWHAGYETGVSQSLAVVDSLMGTSAGNLTRPLLLWLRTRMLALLDDSKQRAA